MAAEVRIAEAALCVICVFASRLTDPFGIALTLQKRTVALVHAGWRVGIRRQTWSPAITKARLGLSRTLTLDTHLTRCAAILSLRLWVARRTALIDRADREGRHAARAWRGEPRVTEARGAARQGIFSVNADSRTVTDGLLLSLK